MPADAWVVLVTLVVMIAVMLRAWLSPAAAVVAATTAVYVLGVVEAEDVLAGLGNPAPVTVAGLYVVAGAVSRSELLAPLLRVVAGSATGRVALARIVTPVAGASAFVANTPVVAMLVPAVVRWSDDKSESPSRYLLPLSYATILGGALTVVGTSTNLVASGLSEDAGMGELALLDPARVAGPVVVAGLVVIVITAPLLVPARRPPHAETDPVTRPHTLRMRVERGGPLDGLTVVAADLRELEGVYLAEIERDDMRVSPVAPDRRLSGDDQLVFVGDVDRVVDLHAHPGLVSVDLPDEPLHDGVFHEVVVSPASPLVGRTVREADFRSRHQAVVVAIDRAGERVTGKLGSEPIRPGDSLLLRTGPDFDAESSAGHRDFMLVNRLGDPAPHDIPARILVATVAALGIIVVGPLLFDAALLRTVAVAVGLLVVSGTIRPREVWDLVDLNVVAMIAAAIGLGRAVAISGLGDEIATGIVDAVGSSGEVWAVLGVLLAVMLLTEAITNVAAIALVFPIALTVAQSTGVDPEVMTIGVAVASSMSFLTPIGYQTNTMVLGPGRYRFSDYLRFGGPLWLVSWLGTSAMVITLG